MCTARFESLNVKYGSAEIGGISMAKWQVQEAKAKFSELMDKAEHDGPQVVTRHGVDRIVVLSIEDFEKLEPRRKDLRELLLGGPKFDDFEIERELDYGREIDLSDFDE
jgi:prevent-host-death family protein